MQILQTVYFSKWAKNEQLTSRQLKEVVEEMEKGIFDANLGGNVFKKRVGLSGRGKSKSARTIVAYKENEIIFFIYGYNKNTRENISLKEKQAYKKLAKLYFSLTEIGLKKLIKSGGLLEVL